MQFLLLYKSYNDEKLQPPKVESAAQVLESCCHYRVT